MAENNDHCFALSTIVNNVVLLCIQNVNQNKRLVIEPCRPIILTAMLVD